MKRRIYLDHAATTPLLPEVAQAMEPWIREHFGNPSSLYVEGRQAKAAIDEAREALSESMGCLFGEITFTSGGTEAVNLAILGTALGNQDERRNRVLFAAAEHHCALHTSPILEKLGYRIEFVRVDREARVDLEQLEQLLGDDVLLVSVMHGNNELGSINDLKPIVDLAHRVGALYFTDAIQTYLSTHPLGYRADNLDADLIAVASHKVYGPKGAGALFVRAGTPIASLQVGGGQEREMRAGTENVAALVGFAAAVKALGGSSAWESAKAARDVFFSKLPEAVRTVSAGTPLLPGHAHLRFPGVSAESVLISLDREGVSASSGAACSSGSLEPSHVMLACGYSKQETLEALRFSFGIHSTLEEAREAARRVQTAVAQTKGK